MSHVLVTGGAGYVGSALVPRLLQRGHRVRVLDLMLFGPQGLADVRSHPHLEVHVGDLRHAATVAGAVAGVDTVVHLACISNDPSFDLDPALGRSVNFDSFRPLVEAARAAGARRFIFASSSSVYGVKAVEDVHEGMSLEPITDYALYKAKAEEVLREHQSADFTTVAIRPATVCGYSPRQRLDIITNIMTNHAVHHRAIRVFGGAQKRPSIHIDDMVRLYVELVEAEASRIAGKVWNAGHENYTAGQIAEVVRARVGADVRINREPSDDPRSYHISSRRLQQEFGFSFQRAIGDAVDDLKAAFAAGKLPNSLTDARYFNIKTMQALKLT